MDRLTAHGFFAAMQQRDDVSRWPGALATELAGAAAMVGLVAIGGALDDAESEADLLAGALHGWSFLDCGVVTELQWAMETDLAIDAVLEWGAKLDAVAKNN